MGRTARVRGLFPASEGVMTSGVRSAEHISTAPVETIHRCWQHAEIVLSPPDSTCPECEAENDDLNFEDGL